MTVHGMVTTTTDTAIAELVRAIVAGPDGAMWFTNANLDSVGQISTADSVTPTPDQGPAATALNVSGTGFAPGETVNVTYGTTSEASDAEPICSATAARDGTFTCTGTVPSGGRPGRNP